jgi:hypothetical protein
VELGEAAGRHGHRVGLIFGQVRLGLSLVSWIFRRTEKREKSVTVAEIVAVKAPWSNSEPQLSTIWPQLVQFKTVIFTRFQQISISGKNWFGTRGSEVQILSPRPMFSIVYRLVNPIPWYWPRCPSAVRCINIGFLAESWMQDHLQKHLQSGKIIQLYTLTTRLDPRTSV